MAIDTGNIGVEARHPCQEGYVSLEGPNIKDGWLGQAACRNLVDVDAASIFLPKEYVQERTDIPICIECPVRDSCLVDSFARGSYDTQSRRAGLVPVDRTRISSAIRARVNQNLRMPLRFSYNGQKQKDFYLSNTAALPFINEEVEKWRQATTGDQDIEQEYIEEDTADERQQRFLDSQFTTQLLPNLTDERIEKIKKFEDLVRLHLDNGSPKPSLYGRSAIKAARRALIDYVELHPNLQKEPARLRRFQTLSYELIEAEDRPR